MPAAVPDATIVKLMKQGFGRKKIEKAVGMCLESARLRRLRNAHGIAKQQIVRFEVSDEVLEDLLRKGLGRRKIAEAVGRDINNERLRKIRDRLGIETHTPRPKIPEADLRSMVMGGMSQKQISEATGVHLSGNRTSRMRKEFGIARRPCRKATRQDTSVDLYKRIGRALRHVSDPMLRDDAASEMYLAVIEGKLPIDRIEVEARRFGNSQLAEWQSKFGPRSLDEQIGEDNFSLLDSLEDQSALDSFDRLFDDDEIWE